MQGTLPVEYWSDASARAATLQAEVARNDPMVWQSLPPQADVWDYLEHKLAANLDVLRKPGQAGWAWHMHVGFPRRGFIWSTGQSEASESSEYTGQVEYGARWWPAIFITAGGNVTIIPFYCPALAWAKSDSPYSHHSSGRT